MDGKPVKVPGRAKTTCTRLLHTVSVEHLEAGLDAQGRPMAWLHRTVAPTIISTFDANAKQEAPFELGMAHQRTFRNSQHPDREPGRSRSCAHRLVPLRVEHPHAFAVQSFVASLPRRPDATRRTFCLR